MGKIKRLSEYISNQIAAGEVIERPASVVKELIENSIDGEATIINISIEDGGKKLIRVSDNGIGIYKEDIQIATERHTTSKISEFEDLENIMTLGFRGEALASMAMVSKLRIESRTKDECNGIGYGFEIHGGKAIGQPDIVGHPQGTTVTVSDLFFNTPARKKFLKNSNSETSVIADIVSRFALIYPSIRFSLKSNNKILIHSFGNGDYLNSMVNIYYLNSMVNIYGRKIRENISPIEYNKDGIIIKGYISDANAARKTRKHQTLSINGRIIGNTLFQKAIETGSRGYIPPGLFPVALINIVVSPKGLDQNVHPSKKQIKCANEDEICNSIIEAIETSLQEHRRRETALTGEAEMFRNEGLILSDEKNNGGYKTYFSDKIDSFLETKEITETIKDMKILGQLYDTYIVLQSQSKTILIDQHAVHERVIYENLIHNMQDGKVEVQKLNVPVTMNLTPAQISILSTKEETLNNLGFTFEDFGLNTIIIRQVPLGLDTNEVKNVVEEVLEGNDKSQWLNKTLISLSCKTAIKANTPLSQSDMEELVQLMFEKNITNCPHGRPAYLVIPITEIEKRFKRIL